MRPGGYTVQQALTPESASVLRQALTLAKSRGHAQVTPLHVAHTMLSSPTGLFRTACQQSHSHPLQCKALELCFNVALNRLPATSSNPVFGSHSLSHPSISNALVAAFKRAQAHQRRGSIESQQQPLLAVKIELEQLIISILDDPSVSRVMREARFSSTQVKVNAEKTISLELCTQITTRENKNTNESYASAFCQSPSSKPKGLFQRNDEDVGFIIENMLMNRRNIVIVGECVDNLEKLVRKLAENINKGDVHESLKEMEFITMSLFSFVHLTREEVEEKLQELRCIVKKHLENGVVLYLGDLKWVSEYSASNSCDQGMLTGQYSHVDYTVMEIGKLGCGIGDTGSLLVMGLACLETYKKCKGGSPSLESIWRLHPVTIPNESLSLGLIPESETGISSLRSSTSTSQLTTSSLPLWLKKYKDDTTIDQDYIPRSDFRERTICFSAGSPSCSTNSFYYEHQSPSNEPYLRLSPTSSYKDLEQASPYMSSPPNSSSSTFFIEAGYAQSFKDLNYENFKTLCTSLEQQVASQKDIIPEIVTTILQCRSRVKSINEEVRSNVAKEETWMCFQGINVEAKEKIAMELARLIFRSSSNFAYITLIGFSYLRDDSTGDMKNKRSIVDKGFSYLERFYHEVFVNPHRVFFLEDIEKVDYCTQLGIKKAIERGSISNSNGKEVRLCDAIIILSCNHLDSKLGACSPHVKQKKDNGGAEKVVSLDLNISLEDTESAEDESFDDIGLLECVDRRILIKPQVL